MTYLDRSLLTNDVITHAGTMLGVPVGNHYAPKEGGWSTGQPNRESYQPYATVFSGPMQMDAVVGKRLCYGANTTYEVRLYHHSVSAVEAFAHLLSEVWPLRWKIGEFNDPPVDSGYKTMSAMFTSVSGVQRIDATDPKTWMVTSTLTIKCVPTE